MDKSEQKTLSDFVNITIPKEFYENDAEIILLHMELSGIIDSILHNRKISPPAFFISDEEEKILKTYAKDSIQCEKFYTLLKSVVEILKKYCL